MSIKDLTDLIKEDSYFVRKIKNNQIIFELNDNNSLHSTLFYYFNGNIDDIEVYKINYIESPALEEISLGDLKKIYEE